MKIRLSAILSLLALLSVAGAMYEGAFVPAFSKTAVIGSNLKLTLRDFEERLPENDRLSGIIICDLPDSHVGVLKCNGRDVQIGEAVDVTELNRLYFIPYAQRETSAVFAVMPVLKSGKPSSAIKFSINVLNSKNNPPKASDVTLTTIRNVAIGGEFSALDDESDGILYKVVDAPSAGDVTLSPYDAQKFVYSPFRDKTGEDSFTYVAVDSLGNTSEKARVTISVKIPAGKFIYSDLSGNPIHYQAIRLAESGAFVGECVGGSFLFRPEKLVTRSEFIAIVNFLRGIEKKDIPAGSYSDYDEIPLWSKRDVFSATRAKIVSGETRDGKTLIRADDIITRNEAEKILENAFGESFPANRNGGEYMTRADIAALLEKTLAMLQNL